MGGLSGQNRCPASVSPVGTAAAIARPAEVQAGQTGEAGPAPQRA